MPATRRALLTATVLAALAAGGVVRLAEQSPAGATPDDDLIDAAVSAKLALIAGLQTQSTAAAELVVAQQHAHIQALRALRSARSAPSAAPNPAAVVDMAGFAEARVQQALTARDPELSRILLLIAGSDAVHGEMVS